MVKWLRRLIGGWAPEAAVPRTVDPFPAEWSRILNREVVFYKRMPVDQKPALHALIRQFLREKRFWGAEDLNVTEEMKVIVAAYAGLLVLGAPEFGLYPRTREVILYPRTIGHRVSTVAPDGRTFVAEDVLLGQAHYRGPVLLAWDSIKPPVNRRVRGSRVSAVAAEESRASEPTRAQSPAPSKADRGAAPEERESPAYGDVIIHEFAHALDTLDGHWDGTPPLSGKDRLAGWVEVFTQEYQTLVRATERGRRTFLDPYGAEDPTEFFAVACEAFFDQPRQLKAYHPAMYRQMADFFRQDPASWMED